MAVQGQSFSTIAIGLTSPELLVTDLTSGLIYEFKVQSRNSYSYSDYSEVLSLLCAFKPEPPLLVTTTNSADQVLVEWDEPVNNGYVIHAYRFFVITSGGAYEEESTECDGTNALVVSNRQCSLSLDTLKAAPFNLVQGDSIWLRLVAINTYGESV
jgi:hypothetical protein